MNRDLSLEEHRTNPPGSRSGSDGGNALSPGGSPGNEESGPDFIVKVKVESEFIDDYSSLIKVEAPRVKMETFQSDSLQSSQDDLSNEHVKQEPCDSPPTEPSRAAQLLEVKQMKLVSCSNCSQLFYSEVDNHHMTHTVRQETDTFISVSSNHSCKSCTETRKNIQESKRPHKCSVCLKAFAYSSSLQEHQKMHTGEKLHKCSLCFKTFAHRGTLVNHQRIHTGEKPYKCSVCPRAFGFLGNLKNHQGIHTGEKPYKCPVCLKAFRLLQTLKNHQRIHTGEKPYKCNACNKVFGHSSPLYRHQKLHIRRKPYKCSVCNKDFVYSSSVKRHSIIHTREKISTSQ